MVRVIRVADGLTRRASTGPEPAAQELAEDDEDDGAEDDEEDDEETVTSGAKAPLSTCTKDAIGEDDDEDPGDDEEEGIVNGGKLIYCAVCGMPPEYCEYGDNYEKCVPWIKQHCPCYLKEVASSGEEKKKKSKRGGGVIRKKEISADKQKVVVYTEARSRKKTVTVVEGLETVGIKLKDAAKLFGRKFASSSSVKDKDTGGTEIVIQGDVILDLPDLLVSEYGISRSKISIK